ncbi:GPN-loop GTPase 3-like protein [Tanacetum coccineum]
MRPHTGDNWVTDVLDYNKARYPILHSPICKISVQSKGITSNSYEKNPQSMAMSSVEAEFVAAAGCYASILWMKSQLSNYDIHYKMLVISPAGSGKRILTILWPWPMDIRELMSLEKDELKLGPNSGLVYCMEHLEENMDERLSEELDNYMEDYYLVFDCPSQIELLSHVLALKNFVDHL